MGVTLSGHIDVPEARRAAVAAALPGRVRLTRAEPGCLSFKTHQARAAGTGWARVSEGIRRHHRVSEGG